MLVATHGKHRAKRSCLFFILLLTSCTGVAVAASPGNAVDEKAYCPASEAYLAEIEGAHGTRAHDKDLSCLTDLSSLADTLDSYQLIDTRRPGDNVSLIANAWRMPVAELRSKAFLQNKRLLLVGEGFSRAQAARDCAVLKQAGFQQVRILLGGADTWVSAAPGRTRESRVKTISAKQLVFEYFNSQVTLVATSEPASADIKALGLSNHYLAPETSADDIARLAINNSSNGFYPIVVIGDSDSRINERVLKLPNVYQLPGGAEAIRDYLEENLWTNLNRSGVPRRYLCGQA